MTSRAAGGIEQGLDRAGLTAAAPLAVGQEGPITARCNPPAYRAEQEEADMEEERKKKSIWLKKFGRPFRVMSRTEKRWFVAEWSVQVLHLLAVIFFIYQAFVLHASDQKIDPIAWRLAFGVTAVSQTKPPGSRSASRRPPLLRGKWTLIPYPPDSGQVIIVFAMLQHFLEQFKLFAVWVLLVSTAPCSCPRPCAQHPTLGACFALVITRRS